MFQLWLVWRFMTSARQFLSLSTLLSLLGLVIGVGSLVVAMAVVSGYQTTLKNSVIDVSGHMMLVRRPSATTATADVINEVKPHLTGLKASTPFVYVESILAHQGKVSGVVLEGVDPNTVTSVVSVNRKIISGQFNLQEADGVAGAVVGRGIAEKFSLEIGDVIRLVTPQVAGSSGAFRPRLGKFRVNGVVDFGHHDFNTRYILSDLKNAQEFAAIGDKVSGFRLLFDNDELAKPNSLRIINELGASYWVRDWEDVNHNLFEAAKIEKIVIFFVLLVIVIAASFSVASTLFVNVIRRFHDISILKAMGADKPFVIRLFTIQGLLLGFMGCFFGMGFGLIACKAFLWAQDKWGLLPEDVYKLNRVSIELRWTDFIAILFATLLICFLATLAPARRGAALPPVEGLRYE